MDATAFASQRIVLAVADDLARKLLRVTLEQQLRHRVVGEARTGTELVRAALTLEPDLVIFELELEHLSGLEALAMIQRTRQIAAVAILTEKERESACQALQQSHVNYVVKPVPVSEFKAAIQAAKGRITLLQQLVQTKQSVERTLQNRVVIHQAKRVLMTRYFLSEAEAHRRLQQSSMNRRIPMVKLAKEVLTQPGWNDAALSRCGSGRK